jgi:hypothetical protein
MKRSADIYNWSTSVPSGGMTQVGEKLTKDIMGQLPLQSFVYPFPLSYLLVMSLIRMSIRTDDSKRMNSEYTADDPYIGPSLW